jgi:hypothetical protein
MGIDRVAQRPALQLTSRRIAKGRSLVKQCQICFRQLWIRCEQDKQIIITFFYEAVGYTGSRYSGEWLVATLTA